MEGSERSAASGRAAAAVADDEARRGLAGNRRSSASGSGSTAAAAAAAIGGGRMKLSATSSSLDEQGRQDAASVQLYKLKEEAAQLRTCIREEVEGNDIASAGDSAPETSPRLRLVQLRGEAEKLRDYLRAGRQDGDASEDSGDLDELLDAGRRRAGLASAAALQRHDERIEGTQPFGEDECRAASEVPLRLLYRSLKVHFRGARRNSRQRNAGVEAAEGS